MFFFDRLRNSIAVCSGVPPVLVHVLLVSCVALYAVIGALIMQALESGSINSNEMDGGHLVNTLNRSADHYAFDLSVNVDEMTPDELMRLDPKIHECVARVVDKLLETGDCTEESLHYLAIKDLDDCYENADFNSYFLNKFDQTTTENDVVSGVRRKEWSFSDSLIFSFTVITTIGELPKITLIFHKIIFNV
ncbi:hypothetical protein AB6A40_008242 [Gnathostoma spinigerum]|uniref:Uncharacterized protein n=1 Tax=Gnathostoma spinigerum TaxID=75299 RepID=A0ABD6ENI6_9BILA